MHVRRRTAPALPKSPEDYSVDASDRSLFWLGSCSDGVICGFESGLPQAVALVAHVSLNTGGNLTLDVARCILPVFLVIYTSYRVSRRQSARQAANRVADRSMACAKGRAAYERQQRQAGQPNRRAQGAEEWALVCGCVVWRRGGGGESTCRKPTSDRANKSPVFSSFSPPRKKWLKTF